MWIRELQVDGFGIFTTFRLAGLGPGLTVLLGANEAGKSTLLAFVRGVLFGFPDGRTRDNPYPPLDGGRHGGRVVLVDQSGVEYAVERHVGKRGGSVSVRASNGDHGGEAQLRALLGSATRDLFRNVYAFSLTELQSFDTLQADAVKAALYGASAGAAVLALPQFQGELQKQLDAVFKPGGQNPLLNQALREYEALGTQIRDIQDGLTRYAELAPDIAAVEERIAAAAHRSAALARAAAELQQRQRLLPLWVGLQADRAQRAALAPRPVPAPSIDALARLEKLLEVHELRQQERERAEDGLAQLSQQRDALVVNDAVLGQADAIRLLYAGADGFDERRERLAHLHADRTTAAQGVARLLAELGPEWNVERVRRADRSLFAREELQRHRERLQGLETDRTVAQRERDATANARRDATAERDRTVAARGRIEPSGSATGRWLWPVVAIGAALVGAGVAAALVWRDQLEPRLVHVGLVLEELSLRLALGEVPANVALAVAAMGLGLVIVVVTLLWILARRRRARTSARLRAGVEADLATAALEKAVAAHEKAAAQVAEVETRLTAAQREWRAWLARVRLPADLSPETAAHGIETLARILELAERLDGIDAETRQRDGQLQEYRQHVAATFTVLSRAVPDDAATAVSVRTLHEELGAARIAATTRASLDTQLANARATLADASRRADDTYGTLQAVFAEGGADDVEAFRARARLAAEHDRLQGEIDRREWSLREIAGTTDLGAIETTLTGVDALSIEEELTRVRGEQADATRHLDELRTTQAELLEKQRLLGTADELAALRAEQECVRARVAHLARQWARAATTRHLLSEAKARFEREHQPKVLEEASRLFARITGHRYEHVRAGLGTNEAALEVITPGGVARRPEELSRGTQEQLYLALRFAYILNHRVAEESLPVVMDDILVNFDPTRAAGAAAAILELAQRGQVLLYTCHPATAALITRLDPSVLTITLGSGARSDIGGPL